MRLPLHTLPAFRTAARLANLRAAAQSLNLTHSAVSQQMRVLEQQLGFAVFERRGRRIALNAAGKALLASVESALATLDDGLRAAAAVGAGSATLLRITVLPSFAHRWLLPRIGRWRARYPDLPLEIDASQNLVDLQRDGFHAAVRTGRGNWPGVEAEPLINSPLIAVGSPAAARRLFGQPEAAFAGHALIGDAPSWEEWFRAAGVNVRVRPVADFNDAGLMLQAAENDIGITLVREMLAADALADGRLVRLSPVATDPPDSHAYYLAYPPALRKWPPLVALRRWLMEELEAAQRQWVALRKATATAESAVPASRARKKTAAKGAARRPRRLSQNVRK